jgi:hypothetical protein
MLQTGTSRPISTPQALVRRLGPRSSGSFPSSIDLTAGFGPEELTAEQTTCQRMDGQMVGQSVPAAVGEVLAIP